MFKWLKWSRKSNHPSILNRNNNNIAPFTRESFIDFVLARGETELGAHILNAYFKVCSPLGTAIDFLINGAAAIPPSVFDTKENAFVPEHPILELLKSPNASQTTYIPFMKRLSGLYSLHGEVFLIATGDVNSPPKELWSVSRAAVSIDEGSDGFPVTMTVNQNGDTEVYFRQEINGKFRFFNRKGTQSSLKDRELFQIQNFNPTGGLDSIRGSSPLQSLYYEIEQWIKSGKHNLSLLCRGGTPSGIFSTDADLSDLTDDQFQRLQEMITNYWSGAENAGRVGFLTRGIVFKPMSQTNKDMDFLELKEKLQKDIYNRYKIPLPLISEKTMTLANLDASATLLYDNAVKPLLDELFSCMTTLLMYRYPDSENAKLSIDEGKIALLATRRNQQAIQLKETGASTINDRRKTLNLKLLDSGGDVVYGSLTDIPIASDDPDDLETDQSENKLGGDKYFISQMQKETDQNGNRKYSDAIIKRIAQEI